MQKKIDALYNLRELLTRNEIMVVGSTALYLHGFDIEVNDVDLEIIASPKSIETIQILSHSTPACDKSKNYSTEENKRYDFTFQGVKFNVWIKEEFSHKKFLYFNYCKVAGVLSILTYMKEYGRSKDYQQIIKLSKQIIS